MLELGAAFQIVYKPQFGRLLKKVRVQGAKKDQGRRVLPVREGLIFLQQRSNRTFVSSLKRRVMLELGAAFFRLHC